MTVNLSISRNRLGRCLFSLLVFLSAFGGANKEAIDMHQSTARETGVELEDRTSRSFAAGAAGALTLSTEYGDIEVVPADVDTIVVSIVRRVGAVNKRKSEEIFSDFTIDYKPEGANLAIEAKFNKGWQSFGGGGSLLGMFKDGKHLVYWKFLREHRFRVSVPARYSVNLNTRYGSVRVGDLEGEVRVHSSTGKLDLGSIGGPIVADTTAGAISLAHCANDANVKTLGGPIWVGQVTGDLVATTLGGSIRVEKVRGSVQAETRGGSILIREATNAVDAKTGGGSVEVTISNQPSRPFGLESAAGSITLFLPAFAGVDIDADASGNRVMTDFAISGGSSGKSKISGSINGGGPVLRLRSNTGGIYIRKRAA